MHNVQLLQVEVPQFLGYPTGDRIAIAKSACPEHPKFDDKTVKYGI
jgi:hypothetical protein